MNFPDLPPSIPVSRRKSFGGTLMWIAIIIAIILAWSGCLAETRDHFCRSATQSAIGAPTIHVASASSSAVLTRIVAIRSRTATARPVPKNEITRTIAIISVTACPIRSDRRALLADERVGFVFQNFNLLPHITSLENVELPMLFGGLPVKERRARAKELLGKVGLADRVEHKPTELSGGQMQRVAIARALAMNPDILLADEPTGNLDSSSGTDIMSLFNELWASGRTLVIITHDPAIAKRASRVVEIHDGRITSDTTA